jgi:predicted TIM-barrel enzyme
VKLPLGINLVHNGGVALLGIAIAAGASFIRVCMLTGAGVWEAGAWDEGCAAELMRRRKELHAEHIKILADVDKKHSVRFPGIDLEDAHRVDALLRGRRADRLREDDGRRARSRQGARGQGARGGPAGAHRERRRRRRTSGPS